MACISFFLALLPVLGSEAGMRLHYCLCSMWATHRQKCGHFGGQPGATGNCALRNGGTLGVVKSEEEPGMETQAISPYM